MRRCRVFHGCRVLRLSSRVDDGQCSDDEHRAHLHLTKRIEIRRDVACVLIGDAHVWHHRLVINSRRILNPPYQVVRRIRYHSRNVGALGDSVERRSNLRPRSRDSRDRMTGWAPILFDRQFSALGITADEVLRFLFGRVSAAQQDQRNDQG